MVIRISGSHVFHRDAPHELMPPPQMIDPRMKFSMEGSTPNFSDPSDVEGATLEQGSQVRLRIKGIRAEVGSMFAIGSIREDYLG